ncbi:hypothetical protein [Brachybacterium sacelli]|uniref:Uncharacterized protein n=1 Tax=Brachybacterium sacelli TaxID=173364 RepID=A0ABS4WXC4_9MICO|nr:hypothetical protein [Brachybacterium sacelli]MBP2380864.1 hypothetical protein [Brachybacterium sacelli]
MTKRLSPPPLWLWARLLLPWPLIVAAVGSLVFLLLLGGTSVPLVGSIGDSRLLCFAGTLLGGVAALAGGMDGPFWRAWDPFRDVVARLVWGVVLFGASAGGASVVFAAHGALGSPAISLFLVTWGAAMFAAVVLGPMWAAGPSLAMTVAAMLTVFSPAQWWGLGFLLDPRHAAVALTCGAACCLAGSAAYVAWGTSAIRR